MLRLTSRPVGAAATLFVFLLSASVAAGAETVSIRDVPLKPWTGFARSWDWTYDALHKLVLSGLAGKVVLNTKPMSRREMALLLADIVRRIQANQVSEFRHRDDLQDILLELLDEFSPELLALMGGTATSGRDVWSPNQRTPPARRDGHFLPSLQESDPDPDDPARAGAQPGLHRWKQ